LSRCVQATFVLPALPQELAIFRQFLTARAFALIGGAFVVIAAAHQPQTRTVFVSAVNPETGVVADLRANEVSITENNNVRPIVEFSPATDRVNAQRKPC
jgi:hypothetical protein